jgi:hypothetical protein
MQRVKTFTIVTKSHLAYAKALAVKVEEFHPGAEFTIFVVDPEGMGKEATGTTAEIRFAADLFKDETFRLMTGYYTADELCNACKPWAHAALLRDSSADKTLYLDSDIFLTGSLAPLVTDLGRKSILLTPHVIKPLVDGVDENLERAILSGGGIFNGGCLALNKSPEADAFVEWWKHRLRFQCLRFVPGLCVDQSWLNFVPGLLPDTKVAICRRLGVNIGHWNLHERPLTHTKDGLLCVDTDPVVFIHFSGWDWRNPESPSRYALTKAARAENCWCGVGSEYSSLLSTQGIERTSELPYTHNVSENGVALTPDMRERFREFIKNRKAASDPATIFSHPEKFMASVDASNQTANTGFAVGVGPIKPSTANRRFKQLTGWFSGKA